MIVVENGNKQKIDYVYEGCLGYRLPFFGKVCTRNVDTKIMYFIPSSNTLKLDALIFFTR